MSWTAAQYLKALRDNLQARGGLTGVQIAGAPLGHDDIENEVIAFIDIVTTEESAALGDNSREEEYRIEGVIEVNSPGFGDDVADAARDRATALLAEVEDEVRNNRDAGLNQSGSQLIRYSGITRKDLRQRMREEYRRAIIEFDVTVTTRI